MTKLYKGKKKPQTEPMTTGQKTPEELEALKARCKEIRDQEFSYERYRFPKNISIIPSTTSQVSH